MPRRYEFSMMYRSLQRSAIGMTLALSGLCETNCIIITIAVIIITIAVVIIIRAALPTIMAALPLSILWAAMSIYHDDDHYVAGSSQYPFK